MTVDPELNQTTGEAQLTPSQRLDRYIASLEERHDFDVMEDHVILLTVERSPDVEHTDSWPDDGWQLVTKGFDPNKGVYVGIVEKYLDPDDEYPARKRVVLAEAMAYSAEVARSRDSNVGLADRAMSVIGPANPSATMSGPEVQQFTSGLEAVVDPLDSLSQQDRQDVLQFQMLTREQAAAYREGRLIDFNDLEEAVSAFSKRMSSVAFDARFK